MIGRRSAPEEEIVEEPKSFDDFELRLGDIMRGERATIGRSLLDVQRELKIKATYIAAIENSDPTAFETPGFIAGYVRSYARYLNMDPEWAYQKFCEEGNFVVAHGMSAAASGPQTVKIESSSTFGRDPFEDPNTPFVPRVESIFSRIEPGALGSFVVLFALIGFIGYGGWSVLQEVQRVQLAPVDQTPGVTAEVDPLSPSPSFSTSSVVDTQIAQPSADALDRLYRPQALDVPVMTARDAPIATLDPNQVATLVEQQPDSVPARPSDPIASALAEAMGADTPRIQVTEQDIPEVVMFASRPAWVRVTSQDGSVLYEKVLDAGEGWALPKTETPPLLRTGNAGAVYFAVNGETLGPAGIGASVEKNIALSAGDLSAIYSVTEELTDVDVGLVIRDAIARRDAAN